MVSCEEAAELLSARMDGELEEGERASLEEHLMACGTCGGLEKRLEAADRLLARAHPKPGPGLQARIEKALEPAAKPTTAITRSASRLLRIAVAALVVIAVSLVITTMSDKADASRVEERMYFLDAMNTEALKGQEAMLKSFEWELGAMRLMVEYSDVDSAQAGPILNRIDELMNEIRRVKQKDKPSR